MFDYGARRDMCGGTKLLSHRAAGMEGKLMRWYYGWNIVAMCILFQVVIIGLGLFSFTFWVVPWMIELGASRSEIMIAPTVALLMMGALSPFVGMAMDRYSIRAMVCTGGAIFSLGFVLLSQATAVWQIVAIYATLIAGGMALAGPMAGQVIAAKWFRARRGLALGLVSAGAAGGGILLPPIVAVALTSFGWRGAHLILALLPALLIIPLAALVIRNSPLEKGVEPEPEAARSEQHGVGLVDREWSTGGILCDPGFLVIAFAFMPLTVAFNGTMHNLGPFMHELGYATTTASSFMSMIGGAMLVSKILFGALADRFDQRYLYWLAASGLATSMALMIAAPSNFWLLLLASGLVGFSTGSAAPLMAAIVANRFGARAFGRVMGLLYPFISLAAIGGLLTGWVRDQTGSYDAGFGVYLIALIPAALLMLIFPQKNEQSTGGRVAHEPS